MKTLSRITSLGLVTVLLSFPSSAWANGVSDGRISLPDGPGSIQGLGSNMSVNPNMGMMSYGVSFDLPQGHAGATPSLGLSYSSGNGGSVVGVGWDLGLSSIERNTRRGLPEYDTDDEFAANGGTELVKVSSGVYRARQEGGFARYNWVDLGTGAGGYWMVESPDGTKSYYGATSDGTEVPSARVEDSSTGNTFRYHLVETVDVHGNNVVYSYTKADGNEPLLSKIEYVFTGNTPRYEVELNYEVRSDPNSTGAPGFLLECGYRLTDVKVSSDRTTLKSWVLGYESYDASGGATRLSSVTMYGADGTAYPAVETFEYSRSLGSVCDACDGAFLVNMGSPSSASGMTTGSASLVDMNGDGLPDLVGFDASADAHRIHLNSLGSEGRPSFSETGSASSATTSGWDFGLANIQAIDINGDGRTDVYDRSLGRALCNDGSGDWVSESECLATPGGGDASAFGDDADANDSAEDPNPAGIQFMDYNGDKRTDWVRVDSDSSVYVFENTEGGIAAGVSISPVGFTFDSEPGAGVSESLSDLNGDGLLDAVKVSCAGTVCTIDSKLSLGFGNWQDRDQIVLSGLPDLSSANVSLEDLNGDGLDDVVAVMGSVIWIATNNNDGTFSTPIEISGDAAADVQVSALPSNDSDCTMLFADMNSNGSTDIVWVNSGASGEVEFLELFPVRPNLLARIENGLGQVQEVSYETSAEQAKRASDEGQAWTTNLSQPMNLVSRMDLWEKLSGGESGSGLHELTEYSYRNGTYDGVEKTFLGFAVVETLLVGGVTQESMVTVSHFDDGVDDYYRKGLLLSEETIADPESSARALSYAEMTYEDCDLDGGLPSDIRFLCQTSSETTIKEGLDLERWVTMRTETEYDGYGNVTKSSNLGVVGVDCDENYSETSYIAPETSSEHPWLIGLPVTSESYGCDDSLRTVSNIYYDGDDFVGLDAGEVSQGKVTRMEQLVSGDEYIQTIRMKYDSFGNLVEAMSPRGSVDNTTAFRRAYQMDEEGLKVTASEIYLEDEEHGAYTMRQEVTYHPLYNLPSETTGWVVYQDGAVTPRAAESFEYDEFMRAVSIVQPGDDASAPSQEISYELGSPVSRTITRQRTVAGEATDVEIVRCSDGHGRTYQTRTLLANGSYTVTGFTEFNSRGAAVRSYQPYESVSADCDSEVPDGVLLASEVLLDGTGRTITSSRNDGAYTLTEYEPLVTRFYDYEDTNTGGTHANTPVEMHTDGLGRMVKFVRFLDDYAASEGSETSLEYDSLSRLVAVVDAEGNRKEQDYDLLGRVTEVRDFNAGAIQYGYDAASNLVSRTDARGVTTTRDYDSMNRLVRMSGEGDGEEVSMSYDFPIEGCDESACEWTAGQLTQSAFTLADGTEGTRLNGFNSRGLRTYDELRVMGQALVSRFSYDNINRQVETQTPDGQTDTRVFGPAGRVLSISGVSDEFTYDERDQLKTMVLENGVTATMVHDDLMRLSSRTLELADGDQIGAFSYDYDLTGNLLGAKNDADGDHALTETYTYDDWYRATEAKFVGDDYEETLDYKYSLIDNVTSRVSSLEADSSAHLGDLEYDEDHPNRLLSAGGITRGYNDAGQTTRRGETELSWDYRGLLSAIAGEELEAAFSYDAAGMPIINEVNGSTVIRVSESFEVRDGIGVRYSRHGMQRLARSETDTLATSFFQDADEDDSITAADAWLNSDEGSALDVSVATLKSAARRMLLEERGDKTFLHQDHIHTVFASTNADGEFIATRSFFPNGAERTSTGFVDRYGFTGQPDVEDTDFIQYEQRFFDQQSGRWLSADPLFEVASAEAAVNPGEGLAAYAYIANRGINGFDVDGLEGQYTITILGQTMKFADNLSADQVFTAFRASLEKPLRDTLNSIVKTSPKRLTGDDVDKYYKKKRELNALKKQLIGDSGNVLLESVKAQVASQKAAKLAQEADAKFMKEVTWSKGNGSSSNVPSFKNPSSTAAVPWSAANLGKDGNLSSLSSTKWRSQCAKKACKKKKGLFGLKKKGKKGNKAKKK